MDSLAIFLTVLLVLGLGALIFLGIRRYRYVRELRSYGWQFVNSPDLIITKGLNVPPFGVGFDRYVNDQILGRAGQGTEFQAFEYACDSYRSQGHMVAMPLPHSLPEFFYFPPDRPLPLVSGARLADHPFVAVCEDVRFGQAVLASIQSCVLPESFRGFTIDHDQIIFLDAPQRPAELRAFIDAVEPIRSRVASLAPTASSRPVPNHVSFYQRDHWQYHPGGDSYFLQFVAHNRGGHSHEARNIIICPDGALPFIALTHHWQTTHSNGKSSYTVAHQEHLMEFDLTFPFVDIGLDAGRGRNIDFELAEFNRRHDVRCLVPRFAHDVFHPRQIEYVLRRQPYPFYVQGHKIYINIRKITPGDVDFMENFIHGFFARIPNFTYKELGAWPRPIAEIENYNS